MMPQWCVKPPVSRRLVIYGERSPHGGPVYLGHRRRKAGRQRGRYSTKRQSCDAPEKLTGG